MFAMRDGICGTRRWVVVAVGGDVGGVGYSIAQHTKTERGDEVILEMGGSRPDVGNVPAIWEREVDAQKKGDGGWCVIFCVAASCRMQMRDACRFWWDGSGCRKTKPFSLFVTFFFPFGQGGASSSLGKCLGGGKSILCVCGCRLGLGKGNSFFLFLDLGAGFLPGRRVGRERGCVYEVSRGERDHKVEKKVEGETLVAYCCLSVSIAMAFWLLSVHYMFSLKKVA